jgi:hypothetical protein
MAIGIGRTGGAAGGFCLIPSKYRSEGGGGGACCYVCLLAAACARVLLLLLLQLLLCLCAYCLLGLLPAAAVLLSTMCMRVWGCVVRSA